LLTAGLTLVILGVLEGGQAWAWASGASALVLGLGVVLLVVFWAVERRVADPVLPLWLLRDRLIVTTSLVAAGVGAVLIGLSSYVPTYVQDALGTGPLVAGFALATLTLGWPMSASQAGRIYLRVGFRTTELIGAVLVALGSGLLLLLGEHSSVYQVGATCFVIGLGMGLTAAPTLIAAQSAVQWQQRGVVTGTNMFFRSMGSAVGVAIFGAIANGTLGPSSHSRGHVRPGPLTTAVHQVFLATVALAVVMVFVVMLIPSARRAQAGLESAGNPAEAGVGD
jgi:MFS family permease